MEPPPTPPDAVGRDTLARECYPRKSPIHFRAKGARCAAGSLHRRQTDRQIATRCTAQTAARVTTQLTTQLNADKQRAQRPLTTQPTTHTTTRRTTRAAAHFFIRIIIIKSSLRTRGCYARTHTHAHTNAAAAPRLRRAAATPRNRRQACLSWDRRPENWCINALQSAKKLRKVWREQENFLSLPPIKQTNIWNRLK